MLSHAYITKVHKFSLYITNDLCRVPTYNAFKFFFSKLNKLAYHISSYLKGIYTIYSVIVIKSLRFAYKNTQVYILYLACIKEKYCSTISYTLLYLSDICISTVYRYMTTYDISSNCETRVCEQIERAKFF